MYHDILILSLNLRHKPGSGKKKIVSKLCHYVKPGHVTQTVTFQITT